MSDSLGSETVFSINRSEARKLVERLESSRKDLSAHLQKVRKAATEISGYRPPERSPEVIFRGRYQRKGYSVEKQVLLGEDSFPVPFLLMAPNRTGKHPALIYLHPAGKSIEARIEKEIEWFVNRGFVVLAPDLPGIGETGSVNDLEAFLGVQTRRSVVGMRSADIVRTVRYLHTRSDIDVNHIAALAKGGLNIPLLHATALDSSIRKIALIDPLVSYESVVMNRFYNVPSADLVANALTAYDLPDLAACVAPRPMMMVNVRDQLLTRASAELIHSQLNVVRAAYSAAEAPLSFTVKDWGPSQSMEEVFSNWLKE